MQDRNTVSSVGRLLIVDDDRSFAQELKTDGERLGLAVQAIEEPLCFGPVLRSWQPTIIAMDLVMPESDGVELLHICARHEYRDHLILMSGGYELFLRMAERIARTHGLRVAAVLPKPFRPKQFSYLLMSLI